MKTSIYISVLLMMTGVLSAQQLPFMEGYNINPYSLSPAFAGIHNINTLFLDYRSDWAGIEGGPTTYQMSYNTNIFKKVGVGGKFIYDKTDIFKQTRNHLLELARPMLESMIHEVVGVKVLSMHHDISTVTGEEVILFSLPEAPHFF